MLNFFRKYQRFFFAITTVVIVISFVFFGTYTATNPIDRKPDKKIGESLTGERIMLSDIEEMTHFLASDWNDSISHTRQVPNLLNDGVIKNDFLETGIASLLVQSYFHALAPELSSRFERAKHYRPYVHPDAAFIKASEVWDSFLPQLSGNLALLQDTKDFSPQAFQLMVDLYLDQTQFSPEMLRRSLLFQQSQYSWITPDPHLPHKDLDLFGFHTLTDWFGTEFLDLVSQFIINMAYIAEKKGYVVSNEEVKSDLIHNVERGYHVQTKTLNLSPSAAGDVFKQQLKWIGLDERQAIKVWKRILLFRRFFTGVGSSAFVDPLPYQDFVAYSFDTATLELFELPKDLRLNRFHSLMKFQFYLSAVAPKPSNLLSVPETFYSPQEVENKNPELVERKYLLEISHVKKESIALRIGVKKMWDWQLNTKNWELLQKEFPQLRSQANTTSERFEILESLDPMARYKVDQFSREAIVSENPEWIEEELKYAKPKKEVIGIRSKMTRFPLEGIIKPNRLIGLIERAPLKKGEGSSPSSELASYSDDHRNYYRIEVLKKSPHKEVITYAEAEATETLDPLLDRFLEEQYIAIRQDHPETFEEKPGVWKPLATVKDWVGRYIFLNVLQAIDHDYQKFEGKIDWNPGWGPYEFYPTKRLSAYMREVRGKLMDGRKKSLFVRDEAESDEFNLASSLTEQWKLTSFEKSITRSDKTDLSAQQAFELSLGSWSNVQNVENGQILFFHLLKRTDGDESIQEELAYGKKLLSDDAQRFLSKKWLEKIQKAKAIHLPIREQADLTH